MPFDFDMGRYAAYVWPAWGITALVLGAVVARTLIAARQAKRELQALERRTPEGESE